MRRLEDVGLRTTQRFGFDLVPLVLLFAIAITGLALRPLQHGGRAGTTGLSLSRIRCSWSPGCFRFLFCLLPKGTEPPVLSLSRRSLRHQNRRTGRRSAGAAALPNHTPDKRRKAVCHRGGTMTTPDRSHSPGFREQPRHPVPPPGEAGWSGPPF